MHSQFHSLTGRCLLFLRGSQTPVSFKKKAGWVHVAGGSSHWSGGCLPLLYPAPIPQVEIHSGHGILHCSVRTLLDRPVQQKLSQIL